VSRRIYIAGAFAEKPLVKRYMRLVEGAGWAVVHDWTQFDYGMPDRELPRDVARHHAAEDLEMVRKADVFWMLVPEGHSKGSWVELGLAIELQHQRRVRFDDASPRIIVSGDVRASIFLEEADERYETHDAALERLKGWK
jgi:hypothetical protein